MSAPRTERPQAPEPYGYSTEPDGMLDWDRVARAIASANVYWIGTVRPDGSPHMHSIWGGFVGDRLFIEGGNTTRWARNLDADPRVSFGVDSQGLHINGRGRTVRAKAGDMFDALADNYGSKYNYRPQDDSFWRIDPSTIIGIDAASMESFATSPTRFVFEEPT